MMNRKALEITWTVFKNNCKHLQEYKRKRGIVGKDLIEYRCYYRMNKKNREYKSKKGKIPEMCSIEECPVFLWMDLQRELLDRKE
jgi:hypothetical protein